MPYLSNFEYGPSETDLGCGPECKCGPCKAGLNGLDLADMDQRVMQDALRNGVRDLRQITAAIFLARHPSQKAEWVQIRDQIARPALKRFTR